jgi:hypothetical protein
MTIWLPEIKSDLRKILQILTFLLQRLKIKYDTKQSSLSSILNQQHLFTPAEYNILKYSELSKKVKLSL